MGMIHACFCTGCKTHFWISAYEKREVIYCPFCGPDENRLAEKRRLEEFKKTDFYKWGQRKVGKPECGG